MLVSSNPFASQQESWGPQQPVWGQRPRPYGWQQPWGQPQWREQQPQRERGWLSGQTWQPWPPQPMEQPGQPQRGWISGQTWQPWAQSGQQALEQQPDQPQRSGWLRGQTWQPWAQPGYGAPAVTNQNERTMEVEYSPTGSVAASASGVVPLNNNWNSNWNVQASWGTTNSWNPRYRNLPSRFSSNTWNMPAQPEPTFDGEDSQGSSPDDTQNPSKFVPGPPSWRKSWAPIPGQTGCFNRCKPRCGQGYGNNYGCRPSCRSSCNLKPTCGFSRPQYNGNAMVCPFAAANNVNNGQNWNYWGDQGGNFNAQQPFNNGMAQPAVSENLEQSPEQAEPQED